MSETVTDINTNITSLEGNDFAFLDGIEEVGATERRVIKEVATGRDDDSRENMMTSSFFMQY
jgi:hypothetical protein